MFGFAEPLVTYIKLGVGAAGGALVAGSLMYWIGHWHGDSAGYARYAAEQTVKDLAVEKDRKKNDARIQDLSNYDFCVDSLKRRGMPVDSCEQLRGIPAQ